MFYFCLREGRPDDKPELPKQGFRWPPGKRRAESCSSPDLLETLKA